jgi:hypothetical protein
MYDTFQVLYQIWKHPSAEGSGEALYYVSRNSIGLTVLDACVKRLTIFTDVEKHHTCELEILATQTRVDRPRALLALLHLRFADNFTARFGHCEFFGRETTCGRWLLFVKDECTRSHLLCTEKFSYSV